MAEHVQLYETTYRNFELSAREQVRLETYGEDIGQNGWLTTEEWRAALTRLALGPGSRVPNRPTPHVRCRSRTRRSTPSFASTPSTTSPTGSTCFGIGIACSSRAATSSSP